MYRTKLCLRLMSVAGFALVLICAGAAWSEQGPVCSEAVPVHVSLAAGNLPLVGKEGTVTATVTVDYDLPDVTLTVEVVGEGKVIDAPTVALGKLAGAAQVARTFRVRFDTPGNKFVRAAVKAVERPGVSWSAVEYLALNVGATASKVGFDPSVPPLQADQVSAGTAPVQAQPVAPVDVSPSAPPALSATDRGASAPAGGATPDGLLTVSGRWYFHDRGSVLTGQRQNIVELLRASDSAHLEWTFTDWNGNFTFPAVNNPGAAGVYVQCSTWTNYGGGNYMSVITPGGDEWSNRFKNNTGSFVFADGNQSVGGWTTILGDPNEKAYWIKDDYIKAYNVPPDSTGRHVAEWSSTSTVGTYYNPGGNIHLKAGDADDTPDTVLHEMGHSVMYNIYGGYMPPFPNCNPHYLMGSSSTGCGWTEGWAQTWHCWTTGNAIRSYPGGGAVDLEAATWGDGYDEGDTVEGRVAGAIWDITDSTNDGYDIYDGSWTDVWDVMWNVNCNTFADFWAQWKARGHAKHGPVACLYQCTIDYNIWPTFGGLPDRTTAEDTPWNNAIDLWVFASDPESSVSELTYTITGNTNPSCGVSIDVGDFVDINPVLNWYGTSTVTISCTDGIRTRSDSFIVTVTAVNDAPVITGLPDVSTNEDTPKDNAIDLWTYSSDPESSHSALTYTITGNTNANCGVSIDANDYVDINPVSNWNGISDVTIRVTDPSGLSDSDTFRITVVAVNDPPVISGLPDRATNEDTPWDNAIDLWAYTIDPETADSGLTYTIAANTNAGCGVSIDSNQYIDINPVLNWYGISDVTVRATDPGGLWDEDTFRITVNSINDTPVLANLPDQLLAKNSSRNNAIHLWVYASDVETSDNDLVYTIMANTDPNCGVSIDISDYVDINPTAGWTGYSDVTIRATDAGLLWAEDTFRILVGDMVVSCADARNRADGSWVYWQYLTTVTAVFPSIFYMEDWNRLSGMRVSWANPPPVGNYVWVAGQMTSYFGERMLNAHIAFDYGADSTPPAPFYMRNNVMGGASPNAYTRKVPEPDGSGCYNVGLLARTTGTVVSTSPPNYFWVDDGSKAIYDGVLNALTVDWHYAGVPVPPLNARVALTGISGATTYSSNTIPFLRPRSAADLQGLGGKVAYLYSEDSETGAAFVEMLLAHDWTTSRYTILKRLPSLAKFDLIIIGYDTGNWTASAEALEAILESGKPVIAVGHGGVKFLDQVYKPDLNIGFLPSGGGSANSGWAQDTGLGVWYFDQPITIPKGAPMVIQKSGGNYEVYNPPSSVTKIVRDPTLASYWPIAQEDRFMQWGFGGGPSVMSATGQQLFVNCLYYMQGK